MFSGIAYEQFSNLNQRECVHACSIYFTGEIGGFLGLLLGASVMTLAEVLDLVLYRLIPWDTHYMVR